MEFVPELKIKVAKKNQANKLKKSNFQVAA